MGAAFAAAIALWFLGRRINANRRQTIVDPASGLEFAYSPGYHSFFFVPMEWAGIVIGALILLVVVGL